VLKRLFAGGKRVQAIKTEAWPAGEKVLALWNEWVEGGKGEGLVLRADGLVFKVKPSITIDAAVIGYTDSSDDPEGVGALLMALLREDGQFQVIGSCGNMPSEERHAFKKALAGKEIASNFRYANSKGALYRFVKPETVIEFKVTDVQGEDSSGDPITAWCSSTATAAGRRSARCRARASCTRCSCASATTSRSTRPTSAWPRCSSAAWSRARQEGRARGPAGERGGPPRGLCQGGEGPEVAVRKLVVWQTNKDASTAATRRSSSTGPTISPGRKDPLQREVRVAPSLGEAQRIADEIIAENVKKGWDRHA
jgi:hypothetical protein